MALICVEEVKEGRKNTPVDVVIGFDRMLFTLTLWDLLVRKSRNQAFIFASTPKFDLSLWTNKSGRNVLKNLGIIACMITTNFQMIILQVQ